MRGVLSSLLDISRWVVLTHNEIKQFSFNLLGPNLHNSLVERRLFGMVGGTGPRSEALMHGIMACRSLIAFRDSAWVDRSRVWSRSWDRRILVPYWRDSRLFWTPEALSCLSSSFYCIGIWRIWALCCGFAHRPWPCSGQNFLDRSSAKAHQCQLGWKRRRSEATLFCLSVIARIEFDHSLY